MRGEAGATDEAPQDAERGDDVLGPSLFALGSAYHTRVAEVLADLPHGRRGFQTLATVIEGEQPSQLALASCLGIDRTVMVYLLDDLVAAGLVERHPNPADRRQRKIVPTAHGLRVYDQLRRQVRAAGDSILDPLTPQERETLRALLKRASAGLAVNGQAMCQADDGSTDAEHS